MLNTFTATTDIVVFKLFKNFIRHIHCQQLTLNGGVVLVWNDGRDELRAASANGYINYEINNIAKSYEN